MNRLFKLLLPAVWIQTVLAGQPSLSHLDSDGRHDFDFLVGKWSIQNRVLSPDRNNQWVKFTSAYENRSFLGGLGNMDEMTLPHDRLGDSIRLFDVATKKWSIYWATSEKGQLEMPPVIGSFRNDVGLFYADDVDANQQPVKSRFTWSNITADSAHWDQAISHDGGKTWLVTWSMEFSRNRELIP